MADKSQRGFYLVVEQIKDELINNPSIKTMTFGDITDVDLGKQTIFPLAHMIIENVVHAEKTMQFSFTILTMEQIDTTKDFVDDLFLGNSNTHDILNTQLAVSNKLVTKLRKGQMYQDGYQLIGDATCEPFFDRFENVLAGWATSFTLEIFNDLDYC
tara:strand:- start:1861 stop:2331 length:471 start_codon:yes stop_codon:yes gene_type:complete